MVSALLLAGAVLSISTSPAAPLPFRWGSDGHEMAARAAAETLPADLPGFFRDAGEQLVYLNPEPDRWRNRPLRFMDQGWSYDHYIDLENIPPGALEEGDRWAFLRALYQSGMERPERDAGFLPYRILEMYQRLVTEWRLWRQETDPRRKAWIEERIVNDAGILGHYVTDAANPHHTTIHFNGWSANAPNPEGYTTDREFHARFESDFVRRRVRYDMVRSRVTADPASVAGNARAAVMTHITDANAQVETLYRLDRDVGFAETSPDDPRTRDFAADRIAAGAVMLRDLWWSAWLESATDPE